MFTYNLTLVKTGRNPSGSLTSAYPASKPVLLGKNRCVPHPTALGSFSTCCRRPCDEWRAGRDQSERRRGRHAHRHRAASRNRIAATLRCDSV